MRRGRAVIAASPSDSDRVAILVGSYMELSTYSGGGMFMTGGGAPVFMPTGFFYRNGAVKSAHFKMLVNQTNEHVPGEMPTSVNEKIEAYTDEQKITANAENLFTSNGSVYYVYYHKKEGRMVIMKW
jgi:hypothetical protein